MALIKLQDTPIDEIQVPWNKPYVIRGYGKNMTALRKWKDMNYLREKMQNVEVDVEIYKSFKDFETSKASVQGWKFDKYLDNLGDNNGEWNEPAFFSDNKGGRTYVPDCDLVSLQDNIHRDIFEDLINPYDYRIGLKNGDGVKGFPDGMNLYIGKNTKTGMHCHIEDDFMLNQIIGKKKVYLMDFEQLTINPFWSKYTNFSRENFFELDWDKIDIYYVELNPGDSICFPPWIWHAVESDGYTIGVAKVWERNDQWEIYKNNPKFLPLKRRFYLSSLLPKLFIDFVRKYF